MMSLSRRRKVSSRQLGLRAQPGTFLRRFFLIASGILVPFAAFAQEEGAKFQQDPVDRVASHFLFAVVVVGIGLVLFSLIRYRGGTARAGSWAVLIVGVGILPMILSGVGTILVFQRAERVDFCLSCHLTMKPFVADMKNPKSNSLAAIHYTNRYIPDDQCYVCHTSYGVNGTVEAKKEGMIDVYKYFTRTYHLPIKLRHPYPNNDCLKCHAGSAKWAVAHTDFKDALFAGSMTCMQCHADSNPAHNVGD